MAITSRRWCCVTRGRQRLFSVLASNSNELPGPLESFSQRGAPLAGVDPPHGHPQGLLGAHQDDELLASRDRRVQQVSLEHEVMLSVQGNDDARELGTLAFVNRQDVGQRQLIEVAKVVFDRPPLKIDGQHLLDAVAHPYDSVLTTLPQAIKRGSEIDLSDGTDLAKIFGLPAKWPRGEAPALS